MKVENTQVDSTNMSRDNFAEKVIEYCRESHQSLNPVYDQSKFTLKDEVNGIVISLHNVYSDYCAAEESQRQTLIAKYIEALPINFSFPQSFNEAKDQILPVLSNRWASDIALLENIQNGKAADISQRLTDNLVVRIVYDLPKTVAYLTTDILNKWSVSQETLFAVAIANLKKRFTDCFLHKKMMPLADFASQNGMTDMDVVGIMHPFSKQTEPLVLSSDSSNNFICKISLADIGFSEVSDCLGLFTASADDWFNPSHILVEDWIRMLPLKGEPVVLISTSDILFVTGADNTEALLYMTELGKRYGELSHSVSRIPILLTPHGWEMFQPAQDHPANSAIQSLLSMEMMPLYNHQVGILKRIRSEYVSACMLISEKDGSASTVSTWTKNVDLLLPKTDWLAFVSVNSIDFTGEIIVPPIPWNEVQAIVGYRMEPTELSPLRYRIKSFPSDQEITQLKKVAERHEQRWANRQQ